MLDGDNELRIVTADGPFRQDEVSLARSLGELLRVVRESLQLEVVFIGQIKDGQRINPNASEAATVAQLKKVTTALAEQAPRQSAADVGPDAPSLELQTVSAVHGLPVTRNELGTHIGVPVYKPNGELYGTLCGYNLARRCTPLGDREIKRLRIAAAAAARLLSQAEGTTADPLRPE